MVFIRYFAVVLCAPLCTKWVLCGVFIDLYESMFVFLRVFRNIKRVHRKIVRAVSNVK